MTEQQVDIIAFAPHPDDVELHCSGTLMLLAEQGFRTGIVDLTRGELSTRGGLETRAQETAEATRILGLHARENLGIPDGCIENTPGNREKVIRSLRRYRPTTVLLPYFRDRHPDHENAARLIKEAVFFSGIEKIITEDDGVTQAAHRPSQAFYYMMAQDFDPAFIVDVSGVFDRRLMAIRAYATQFHTGEAADGPETYISTPDFMEAMVGRARRLGFLAGGRFGEGFLPVYAFGLEASAMIRPGRA